MKTLFYILLSYCVQFILSMPNLDLFFPAIRNPNLMRLECILDGVPDPNGIFEITYTNNDSGHRNQPTDDNVDYLTYNITANSEARIRCRIDTEHSQVVEFAAIPNVPDGILSIDVFRGTHAMLTCPIPLPTILSLHSYTMWEQILNSTPVQLGNDSGEYMLSQDNTTLSVLIPNSMDERMFRCKMKVRRCSEQKCGFLDDIIGPFMELNVFERSEIEVFPPSLMVTDGDTALFYCNAAGSNISVSWVLNGSACSLYGCEQNGTSINRTMNSSNISLEINTTLEIRTGELHSVLVEEESYSIDCVVEQYLNNSSLTNVLDRTIIFMVNPVPATTNIMTNIMTSGSANPETDLSTVYTTDTNGVTSVMETTGTSIIIIVITIGVTVPVSILILLVVLVCICVACIMQTNKRRNRDTELPQTMLKGDHKQSSNNLVSLTEITTKLEQEKFKTPESQIQEFSDSNFLIPGRHIQLVHTIGEGEFGLVYRSYLTGWQGRTTAQVVAVKTLKSFYSAKNIKDLIAESHKMRKFNHPNVMGLIGICIDVGEKPYIVMPFMENGSLLAYLKKERSNLTVNEDAGDEKVRECQRKLMSICLQVAKGMSYLAKKKFVHRDLAARNCMIDNKFLIKVGDFGLSEDVYATNYFRQGEKDSVRLPVKWMALESLIDGIFSEKTDVWSFGVTCWEIFSLGHTPYPAIDPFSLVKFLERGERLEKPNNASCTQSVYDYIAKCWSQDPEERPCFKDLVHEINSRLEAVAGYFEFSAFSSAS